jgi:hypothetical protein
MEVTITRTGKRLHLAPEVGQAFIEAGLAELYIKPALTPAQTNKFTVGHRQNSGPNRQGDRVPADKLLVIELDMGHMGKMWFDGLPDQAAAFFEGIGFACPADVLTLYKELYGKPVPRPVRTAKGIEYV